MLENTIKAEREGHVYSRNKADFNKLKPRPARLIPDKKWRDKAHPRTEQARMQKGYGTRLSEKSKDEYWKRIWDFDLLAIGEEEPQQAREENSGEENQDNQEGGDDQSPPPPPNSPVPPTQGERRDEQGEVEDQAPPPPPIPIPTPTDPTQPRTPGWHLTREYQHHIEWTDLTRPPTTSRSCPTQAMQELPHTNHAEVQPDNVLLHPRAATFDKLLGRTF